MIHVGDTASEVRDFLTIGAAAPLWHPAEGRTLSRCPVCLHYAAHKDCADCATCRQLKKTSP